MPWIFCSSVFIEPTPYLSEDHFTKLKYSSQSHQIPDTSSSCLKKITKTEQQWRLDGKTSNGLLEYPLVLMMWGSASSVVVLCLNGISYPVPAYYIQNLARLRGKLYTPLFILSECCPCVEFKTGCLLRWVGCIYAAAVNTAVWLSCLRVISFIIVFWIRGVTQLAQYDKCWTHRTKYLD